jgi:DNA-binding NtrC family response regulator
MAGRTLFAFIDPKDPFMAGEIAGEERPGPILSLLEARRFDRLNLFYTPAMRPHAESTRRELADRYPACDLAFEQVPVADPKDYSALMGSLARQVRELAGSQPPGQNFVCVSSGTAEMRAIWFLITAAGILPATLLQVGSPAEPLFGGANVKEVRFDSADWSSLRDLLMPLQFFRASSSPPPRTPRRKLHEQGVPLFSLSQAAMTADAPARTDVACPELDNALQELGIFIASAVLRDAAERSAIAADSDYPVLFLGETGTGKELFARLVHRLSGRRQHPLVAVNCAAIPKELVESHLFGHVKGAFTGAGADQKGKFEQADGSTLFLDEIGELPLEVQAKLLRIVQDGMLEPVGSSKARHVDVRIVAATNRNLAQEVAAGRFREDLYYRLEVVQVRLPPLRDRPGEIAMLAAALLKQINHRRLHPRKLSKDALRRLELHSWPGNVRELANVLHRSVLYSRTEVLGPDDLIIIDKSAGPDPMSALPEPAPGFRLEAFLASARKQLILRALEKAAGNQSTAAELLGISKQAISRFVKQELDNSD